MGIRIIRAQRDSATAAFARIFHPAQSPVDGSEQAPNLGVFRVACDNLGKQYLRVLKTIVVHQGGAVSFQIFDFVLLVNHNRRNVLDTYAPILVYYFL